MIDDTSVNESKAADDGENEFNEPDILEQNIAAELEAQPDEEILIEEVLTKELDSTVEHEDEPEEEEEEEEDPDPDEDEIGGENLFSQRFITELRVDFLLADDSIDFHDSESENSSAEEVDDDEMMARAIRATAQQRGLQPKPAFQISNDEPIALDDTDEDEEPQQKARQEKYQSDNERSSEYSVDNNVLGESEAEEEEEDDEPRFSRPKILNSKVLLARRLVKNSFKVLRTKREGLRKIMAARAASIKKHAREQEQESIVPVKVDKPAEEKLDLAPAIIVNPTAKLPPSESLAMDISTEEPKKSPLQEVPSIPDQKESEVVKTSEKSSKTPVENKEKPTVPATTEKTNEESDEKVNEKSSGENSNESSHHDSSLLTEITNCSLDEIFNRYVHKNNDQSPTLDEFQEELFYCLQQNNQEIEKAKLLWNERLHVKYKIRELMETIRRHRAVMEIETFGFKPENAGNNSHPVISSKSSTTTNSETDHFEKNFRMSTESVSRLIQDVRATILKRDEKQRTDDLSANNAGDNSLASQWNNLQSNSAQGRQGQIIDVQSIINDFRQKNPQEIPRRGRRMKNSFGNNYFDNPQSQIDESRAMRSEFMSNVTNNSHDFNSTMKSNQSQSGYPEVSLHPVQNLYKNLANASGPSGSGAGHFGGQKSSLLQSILTKVRLKHFEEVQHSTLIFLAINEKPSWVSSESRVTNHINTCTTINCS